MTTEAKTQMCDVQVNRGEPRWPRYQPCGRVAAGNSTRTQTPQPMCNLHLKAEERSIKRGQEWEEKFNAKIVKAKETDRKLAAFDALLEAAEAHLETCSELHFATGTRTFDALAKAVAAAKGDA